MPFSNTGFPKESCINCHFFVKTHRPNVMPISPEERDSIRQQFFSRLSDWSLGCHFTVWDAGHNNEQSQSYNIIVKTDRKNSCFFWKYRHGMLLPAAEILQKREADLKEAAIDRRYAIIGLWIAALSLVFTTVFTIVQFLLSKGTP